MRGAQVCAWIGTVLLFVGYAARPCAAVPAFAKKYRLTCSTCHSIWPMLNAYGRQFKENGYRPSRTKPLSKAEHVKALGMTLFRGTPLAVRMSGTVLEWDQTGAMLIRPLREVAIFIAGNVMERVSAFFELAAEDATDWDPEAEMGKIGFHPLPALNVVIGYGPPLNVDPYQPLNHARFTRRVPMVVHAGFAAGEPLGGAAPFLSIYGRLWQRLFYTLGISSGVHDLEGADPKDWNVRIAVDVTSALMIGGFTIYGDRRTDNAIQWHYRRTGIDFQYQTYRWGLIGAYLRATDRRRPDGVVETHTAYYIQCYYILMAHNLRPLLAPFIRIERYTLPGSSAWTTDATFGMWFYPGENVRIGMETWRRMTAPAGEPRVARWQWTVDVAF